MGKGWGEEGPQEAERSERERLENGHCGQVGPALGSRGWQTARARHRLGLGFPAEKHVCRTRRIQGAKPKQRRARRECGTRGQSPLPGPSPSASPRRGLAGPQGLTRPESRVWPCSGSGLGASEAAEGSWPPWARVHAWPAVGGLGRADSKHAAPLPGPGTAGLCLNTRQCQQGSGLGALDRRNQLPHFHQPRGLGGV